MITIWVLISSYGVKSICLSDADLFHQLRCFELLVGKFEFAISVNFLSGLI